MINQKKIFSKYPLKIKTFGNSMYPTLINQDIVYIKKIDFNKIIVDDIICIYKYKKIFTHRVIYKKNKFLITKGDSNLISDGKVFKRNVLGKIYSVKRGDQTISLESIYLFQSTIYFKEIVKISKKLKRHSLDFVFLKGLPLQLFYNRTHPKRIYGDCDLLINKNQIQKVTRALESLKYKAIDTSINPAFKSIKDKEVEITFIKFHKDIPIILDVHLEPAFLMTNLGKVSPLYSQELIDEFSETLIKNKRYITVNSQKFPILSKDYLFVYLLLHLYHHNFWGTHRYELIRTVIQKENLNLKEILKIIRLYKLENFIFSSLAIFSKFYTLGKASPLLVNMKVNNATRRFVKKQLNISNIFDGEERIKDGIQRFRNIFVLSPNNFFVKIKVFFSPKILVVIFWVFSDRLRSLVTLQKSDA